MATPVRGSRDLLVEDEPGLEGLGLPPLPPGGGGGDKGGGGGEGGTYEYSAD